MNKMFVVIVLCVIFFGIPIQGAEYYVATDGNDKNPGTFDKPFVSIERARDAVRALKKSRSHSAGGVTVYIRGGKYYITKTITA